MFFEFFCQIESLTWSVCPFERYDFKHAILN
jgi:hypothetical protein